MKIFRINNINTYETAVFKGESKKSEQIQTAVESAPSDEFVGADKFEPPFISEYQLKKNKITDEQIIQINKSKKLPNNATLRGIPKFSPRTGAAYNIGYDSFENRFHFVVEYYAYSDNKYASSIYKPNRDIPEGYVAARGPDNKVFVVVAEDAIDDVKSVKTGASES